MVTSSKSSAEKPGVSKTFPPLISKSSTTLVVCLPLPRAVDTSPVSNFQLGFNLFNKKEIEKATKHINYEMNEYAEEFYDDKKDKEIKVKKYISEDMAEFKQSYVEANEGKNVLVIAPTGAGKGYCSNQVVKKHNIPLLNVLPNASITEQQANDYKVMSAYGKIKEDETKSLEYCLEKSKIVGATWNKLSDLSRNEAILKFDSVVADI